MVNVRQKRWTENEIKQLSEMVAAKLSHKEIGRELGRSETSVRTKISRMKFSKPHKSWQHLTPIDCIELIRKVRSCKEFNTNPDLPGVNILYRILEVDRWVDCLLLANLSPQIPGAHDREKLTLFYVIKLKDIDNTEFFKYGLTQQKSVKNRFPGKNFEVIRLDETTLDDAISLEQQYNKKRKYIPKDPYFRRGGKSGFTECFIDG